MTQILLDETPARNSAKRAPLWIIRECQECGGHPVKFEGWDMVFAFCLQGWSAMRDGDVIRVWFSDAQEGSA